jgi:hypothetical protein
VERHDPTQSATRRLRRAKPGTTTPAAVWTPTLQVPASPPNPGSLPLWRGNRVRGGVARDSQPEKPQSVVPFPPGNRVGADRTRLTRYVVLVSHRKLLGESLLKSPSSPTKSHTGLPPWVIGGEAALRPRADDASRGQSSVSDTDHARTSVTTMLSPAIAPPQPQRRMMSPARKSLRSQGTWVTQ